MNIYQLKGYDISFNPIPGYTSSLEERSGDSEYNLVNSAFSGEIKNSNKKHKL